MKTVITVGQSVQVFNIGMPEHWNKCTVSKEFEGDIDEQHEIDELFKVVEKAHEKHSQSVVAPDFVGAVKKETITDLKKEFNVGVK